MLFSKRKQNEIFLEQSFRTKVAGPARQKNLIMFLLATIVSELDTRISNCAGFDVGGQSYKHGVQFFC
jgi:hypothetical protein